MKTNIYLFEPLKLKRSDNTLKLERIPDANHSHPGADIARELAGEMAMNGDAAWWKGSPTILPVERVEAIHAYDSLRINSQLLTFLSKKDIPLHLYNYYGNYTGSYLPRDARPNGNLLRRQCLQWSDEGEQIMLSKELVSGAAHNMGHNIKYAVRREHVPEYILDHFEAKSKPVDTAQTVEQLMGTEGNIRSVYYNFLDLRLTDTFQLRGRKYNPPDNPGNALVSFLNMMCYATIINELHRTQLNPLIGFYHKPGRHRFPLAYDLAELFKPLIVDRLIIKLVNREQLNGTHFEEKMNGTLLNSKGRYIAVRGFEKAMRTTVKHRKLKRSVSYRRLIRQEAYKLIKHLMGEKEYHAFRIWW